MTHRLNLSRDRLAIRRDDERRRADDERTAIRVRADLGFRLSRHRDALRAAIASGTATRLETEHDALVERAAETDVIDALGQRYLAFMAILQREEAALRRLTATGARGEPAEAARAELAALEPAFETYRELFALPDPSLR